MRVGVLRATLIPHDRIYERNEVNVEGHALLEGARTEIRMIHCFLGGQSVVVIVAQKFVEKV